ESRDALYKAQSPNFFRLKIGELRYADLTFPLGARRGTKALLELIGNFPADTRITADLTGALGDAPAVLPRTPGLTGPAPRIMVNNLPEVMEAPPPKGKLQEVAVPAVINGRIGTPGEEDRYRLLVKPGMQLHFEVFANRLGSPLDGVLSLREESGAELANNDDRPDTVDPSFDFQVTAEMKTALLSLRDVAGRGGPNFVYRIVIEPSERPDFRLTLLQDRVHIPQAGY